MVRKIEVLIADDNRLSRELVRAALEKYNANFTEATTGHQVLEIAASKSFDIIFQDFLMPDYNGLELSRLIRDQNGPSSKAFIVGMSASTDLSEEVCRSHGMNTFLCKPFNIARLRQLFETATGAGTHHENNVSR